MILEQLTLRNFCLFRGKQTFDLAPALRYGNDRPIVLFGGINGGGKTTLFDAIQLALYGLRARCSKRADLSYEDFLLQCIHHGVPMEEGAGVGLSFRYIREGQEYDYEVRRDWRLEEGKLRESLMVLQDGLPNFTLGRSWPQVVEELIPIEISQLFFFDGEKIRSLAEDKTSSETLGAAIRSLLGLDIVERLIADASVLEIRLAKQSGPPEQREQAEVVEQHLKELQGELEPLVAERAALENRRLRADSDRQKADERFAAMGGKHWNERQAREERLVELKAQQRELETRLLVIAGGELPLALVPDLLKQVEHQAIGEARVAEAEIIQRLLRERDMQLLRQVRSLRPPAKLLAAIRDCMARDREQRKPAPRVERRLQLSEHGRSLLRSVIGRRRGQFVRETSELLDKLALVQHEREDMERALTATPAEPDISQVVEQLKAATEAFAILKEQANRLDKAIAERRAGIKECEARLQSIWHDKVKWEFEREDRGRMTALAAKTRNTMQEFLRRATERKIDRLSELITESFRFLLRKRTFVERILIDPATFAVTLYDAKGNAIPRQRLSEGEKQIFAVAMLWGLARASARPLPAVIDTPMARLDAAHRRHLVERYFPHASHQVIVLSTDTEVDRQYYELLRPSIARAYHLSYDEQTKATVGEEGYFWNS